VAVYGDGGVVKVVGLVEDSAALWNKMYNKKS
jgi:hypothetical protein